MTRQLGASILFIRAANLEIRKRSHAWHPPTDLFETDDGYTVRLEIAGMNVEDFSILYDQNLLVVSGRRPLLNQKCAYHRMEIPTGEFIASIELPSQVDINEATAEYENGFLTINLPRKLP
ncbi:MAG: Hsp20/alpha crystallin family protein, partial [Chloroflexi bacterium]|nr:Hsp20/alpha crystallin family protein [Chloroflexota bacterium]